MPKNTYGKSKLNTENIIKENFKSYLILRLPSILGSNLKKGLVHRIFLSLKKDKTVKLHNLNSKFNNIFHVDDLIKISLWYLKKKKKTKKTINICSKDNNI